jgi:putative transcriptional regulator
MAIEVRLRELLERRGMAQTELQAQSRLGYSTINALYHSKTTRVEFSTLETLCEVLDCGVGEILRYVPEMRKRGRA